MKRYFAKYIPAEGEIKDGESGLTSSGHVFKAIHTHLHLTKGKQKVKLFLCSYDVKIGDVVPEYGKIVNAKISSFIFEDGKCQQKMVCYKVIGEISPRAIGVNQWDEFNDEDIMIIEICSNYNGKHLWKDCNCKMGFIDGVLIKGSDGHFH